MASVIADVAPSVPERSPRPTVHLELAAVDAALVALALEQLIAAEGDGPVVDRALALHAALRERSTTHRRS
jgi:hypothetical protein